MSGKESLNRFNVTGVVSKYDRSTKKQIIYVRGYKNNSKLITKLRFDHQDYFYYPSNLIQDVYDVFGDEQVQVLLNKEYKSYTTNKSCYKVVLKDSMKLRKIKKGLKEQLDKNSTLKDSPQKRLVDNLHMSDVPVHQKFIHDNNITWSKRRHIVYIDIENWFDIENPTHNKPQNARQPITSIQMYSNFQDEYYMLGWHPSLMENESPITIKQSGNVKYILCREQTVMLQVFTTIFKDLNPDIITGWYSKQFDIPYIIKRMQRVGLDPNELSPYNYVDIKYEYTKTKQANKQEWKFTIKGVDHLDMLLLMKKLDQKFPDYKLDTVAKKVLETDYGKQTQVSWKDWLTNFDGFLKYGLRDVQILVQMDRKLHIFETFITFQQITNIITLEKVFTMTRMVESYVFTQNWQNLVFMDIKQIDKRKYKGAYVMKPIPGLHKNVAIMDYASLYPNTIMSFNLSDDTFIISQQLAEEKGWDIDKDVIPRLNSKGIKFVDTGYDQELVGKRHLFYAHETKTGLFSRLQQQLFLKRKAIKKQMKQYEQGSFEYISLDKRQYSFKILLNSAYGAFGSKGYRFYKLQVAQAITYFARKCIFFARKFFGQDRGMPLIYTDTDSIFVRLLNDDDSNVDSLTTRFNSQMKDNLIRKYNNGLDDSFYMMELQYEKFLTHIYFGKVKKRYYGVMRDGHRYIKGLTVIKKDTPQLLKDRLTQMMDKCIYETLEYKDIQDLMDTLKSVSYEEVGIYKSFNRDFKAYKTQSQHLKGALYANQKLGTCTTAKDIPLMFYINSLCQDEKKSKDRAKVICLKKDDLNLIDERTDIFTINYDEYFKKQVITPLEEFDLIDTVNCVIREYKRKNSHYYTLKSKQKCPLCGKKHSAYKMVVNCCKRYLKENDNQIMPQIKNVFIKYKNQFL